MFLVDTAITLTQDQKILIENTDIGIRLDNTTLAITPLAKVSEPASLSETERTKWLDEQTRMAERPPELSISKFRNRALRILNRSVMTDQGFHHVTAENSLPESERKFFSTYPKVSLVAEIARERLVDTSLQSLLEASGNGVAYLRHSALSFCLANKIVTQLANNLLSTPFSTGFNSVYAMHVLSGSEVNFNWTNNPFTSGTCNTPGTGYFVKTYQDRFATNQGKCPAGFSVIREANGLDMCYGGFGVAKFTAPSVSPVYLGVLESDSRIDHLPVAQP